MMGPVLMNTMSMREYAVGVILMSMNSIVWVDTHDMNTIEIQYSYSLFMSFPLIMKSLDCEDVHPRFHAVMVLGEGSATF